MTVWVSLSISPFFLSLSTSSCQPQCKQPCTCSGITSSMHQVGGTISKRYNHKWKMQVVQAKKQAKIQCAEVFPPRPLDLKKNVCEIGGRGGKSGAEVISPQPPVSEAVFEPGSVVGLITNTNVMEIQTSPQRSGLASILLKEIYIILVAANSLIFLP